MEPTGDSYSWSARALSELRSPGRQRAVVAPAPAPRSREFRPHADTDRGADGAALSQSQVAKKMRTSQSYIARIGGGLVRPLTDALERFGQTRTRFVDRLRTAVARTYRAVHLGADEF